MRRRFLKVMAITVMGLAVIWAGITLWFRTSDGPDILRGSIERLIGGAVDAEVQIGALDIGWLPPGLILENVLVKPHDAGLSPARAQQVEARLRLWPSPTGAWVLQRIRLTGVDADIDIAALQRVLKARQAEADAAPPSRFRPPSRYAVQRLEVRNASLRLQRGDDRLALPSVDIDVLEPLGLAPEVSVNIDGGTLALAERGEVPIQLRGTATVDRGEKRLQVHETHADFDAVVTTVAGELDWSTPSPRLNFNARSTLRLTPLGAFLREAGDHAGHIDMVTRVGGSVAAPDVDFDAKGHGLRWRGQSWGEVEAAGKASAERVQIEQFALDESTLGRFEGNGRYVLGEDTLSFAARLERASLPAVLERLGVRGAWVRLWTSGEVRGRGTLTDLRLAMDFDGLVHRFESLNGSYRAARSEAILKLRDVTVRGPFVVTSQAVTLTGVHLLRRQTDLRVDGMLGYGNRRRKQLHGFDLRVRADALDLADIAPIAGVDFAGQGTLAAALEGAYADPIITGTLDIHRLHVLKRPLGNTKAGLIYRGGVLTIDRAVSRYGGGSMRTQGYLDLVNQPPSMHGSVEAEGVELASLARLVDPEWTVGAFFQANVDGKITVSGPMEEPRGNFTFQTAAVLTDGASLGGAALSGAFGEAEHLYRLEATLSQAEGLLAASVQHHRAGDYTLSARWDALQLEDLGGVAQALGLTGQSSGEAQFAGILGALNGDAHLTVVGLGIYGLRMGRTYLEGRAEAGQLDMQGDLMEGRAQLALRVALHDVMEHEGLLSFDDVTLHQLVSAFEGVEDGWSVEKLRGSLHSRGPLRQPQDVRVTLTLNGGKFRSGGVLVEPVEPVELTYRNQVYRLKPTTLAGDDAKISVQGVLPLAADMRLQLTAEADASALSAWVPGVLAASGKMRLEGVARGHLRRPDIRGKVWWRAGSIRFEALPEPIHDIDLHLGLSGHTMEVLKGDARFGGGDVELKGFLHWPESRRWRSELSARLDEVRVTPVRDLSVLASGVLSLIGPQDGLLLDGRLRIKDALYSKSLALEALIPRRSRRWERPETGATLGLNVRVRAPRNIWVRNNVLDAEFAADVVLTGTWARPGLLGSITPLEAQARYGDNTFQLVRGLIDFTEEYRIFSQFDVQAKTEACGMQIEVQIEGDSEHYEVRPQGRDANGEVNSQDILACLQFGLRLDDFVGHGGVGLTDTLPGGLDALWTVSGLDEKVRKLLPIGVDEFRLTSRWSSQSKTTAPMVLVGKQVGGRLEVKYLRSLDEYNEQFFSLEYRLSPIATLQGTWASDTELSLGDLGVDFRLHWEFD